jgi:hypothetical protein
METSYIIYKQGINTIVSRKLDTIQDPGINTIPKFIFGLNILLVPVV